METWTNPTTLTSWPIAGAGASLAQETTIKKSGTYSAKLTRAGTNCNIHEDLASPATYDGQVLAISQFTLHALTKKGNRPSYIKAAKPEIAMPFYENFIQTLENVLNKKIEKGIFGADMKVSLINDGPVTIWIDSKNKE
jgi:D-tyrosyl-tRNA(Tyr) deacylase